MISIDQAMVVAGAIESSGPAANVLVFGCGRDSRMWFELASPGRCLFVEDTPKWAERVRAQNPRAEILEVSYKGRIVRSSLPIDEAALAAYPVPEALRFPWDVIIIDGPHGFASAHPGRSLPIYWSAKIAQLGTHVFVDDYQRPLENAYAKRFLGHRPELTELPRARRFAFWKPAVMLWSAGRSQES